MEYRHTTYGNTTKVNNRNWAKKTKRIMRKGWKYGGGQLKILRERLVGVGRAKQSELSNRFGRGKLFLRHVKSLEGSDLNNVVNSLLLRRLQVIPGTQDSHGGGGVNRPFRISPRSRRALLDYLTSDKIDQLTVSSKQKIMDNLFFGIRADQRVLVDLLCSTTGHELYQLKQHLDTGYIAKGYSSILQVLSGLNPSHYQEVMHHFDAHRVRMDGHSGDNEQSFQPQVKMVSDIDDTLFCSLHDYCYRQGTLYPGVREFLGVGSSLTLLSARPRAARRPTVAKLWGAGFGVLVPSFLWGSLGKVGSHASMAEKKVDNFRRYRSVFSDEHVRWVFIGDSGQGDITAGKEIVEDGSSVLVLIHDVVGSGGVYRTGMDKRRELMREGICVFNNYGDAVDRVYERRWCSKEDVERVYRVLREDMGRARYRGDVYRRLKWGEVGMSIPESGGRQ